MHASVHLTSALVALIGICQGISSGALQAAEPEPVGTFTAVQGQVQMTRPGGAVPVSVKLSDAVAYKAIIETQDASRAKALFLDDSMLAVAENTKIQINEQIYDPKHGKRNMVFNLLEGKVRALVTKVFQGSGSRFEIRTPSAMAAARGTYFVVWIEKGASESGMPSGVSSHVAISPAPAEANPALLPSQEFTGIANIGDSGSVDFTSNGQTVTVKPGHFAIALPGQPPAPPVPLAKNIPPQVSQAIR
ncbi:MAG: FecR domain-containing protein, partial [Nitrospirae bacterium]|nr:FecR domain-containing protein [Nitrospirota bacterium]